MKLAISQIAWEAAAEPAVLDLLVQQKITALETVPARLSDAANWKNQHIQPVAMQSLLYGQPEWNLFTEDRYDMLVYLQGLIRSAAHLGITKLVFGSPKNRWVPDGMNASEAHKAAQRFFTQLAGMAAEHSVELCLEPNPPEYHCNFLTTTQENITFIRKLNKPHLKLNLDLGALQLTQENPVEMIDQSKDLIGHVHISEPYLKPVAKLTEFHKEVVTALKKNHYAGFCSIEMKKFSDDTTENLEHINQTLTAVVKVFRD